MRAGSPRRADSQADVAGRESKYVAAAFPSACGKTNLAMMQPVLDGWRIETVGDDIWMKFGEDGQLYAINPEAGFFGVAPGTAKSNRTRCADSTATASSRTWRRRTTASGGKTWAKRPPPDRLARQRLDPERDPAAHPNARFRARGSARHRGEWSGRCADPAILFGGRRATVVPLIHESRDWNHGTFLGSIISSEKTAAAAGTVGELRRDPMAMLPFCGYNMADYWAPWLEIGRRDGAQLPRIFYVNWFRKGDDGSFLWPGFGENSRVLKWVYQRCAEKVSGVETPIGTLPGQGELDPRDSTFPPTRSRRSRRSTSSWLSRSRRFASSTRASAITCPPTSRRSSTRSKRG